MVELLSYWLKHQLDVLEKRLSFELAQYKTRLEVVEALIIGATHAQELVKIFQQAEGKAAAKELISQKYKLSAAQAEVIANMSLSQVTRPDVGKYTSEKASLSDKIEKHEELLASRPKRINLLKQELKATEKKFGDLRRTAIDGWETNSATLEGANVAAMATHSSREPLALALYSDNGLKITPKEAFSAKAKVVKADEALTNLLEVAPDAFVLAISNASRIFSVPVDKITVTTRGGKNEASGRYLKLENEERIVQVVAVPGQVFNEASQSEALYLVEFTAQGKVKKTPIAEYKTATHVAINSLKLGAGDEVVAALLSNGRSEYVISATNGQTLRFSDEKLSSQGRIGQGQAAINLDKEARVASVASFNPNAEVATPNKGNTQASFLTDSASSNSESNSNLYLLQLTRQGLLKKTLLDELALKDRAARGIPSLTLSVGDSVVASAIVKDGEQVLVATDASGVAVEVASLKPSLRGGAAHAYSSLNNIRSDATNLNLINLARIVTLAL
jgi:DNA gyrase subunit A